ncbi:MAG: sigma factor-like helix-turn-helix DNA-binding protein [Bradymonadaceae bacterium]
MASEDSSRRTTSNKRGARKGLNRSTTISSRKLSSVDLDGDEATLDPDLADLRPSKREDCRLGERPCPFVSCKYHLYLDVNPRTGSIKLNFPDLEVWELPETCALDVAERGGMTLEEVGELLNLTRERIRQVESKGIDKIRDEYEDELEK